jgi:hypothetical protein
MKRARGQGPVVHIVDEANPGVIFAAEQFDQNEPPTTTARMWRAKAADVKIKRVCRRYCNSGWLGDLEQSVQPLLTPMILGQKRVLLDADAQRLIARWAVKTATLARFLRQTNYPTQGELQWIRQNDRPPVQNGVWLGAYGGTAQSFLNLSRHDLEPPKLKRAPAFHAELTTLVFLRLFVVVLQFPDAKEDISVGTHDNVMTKFTVKLWPPTGFNVRWPPLLGVDDDGILKFADALGNGLIQVFMNIGKVSFYGGTQFGGFLVPSG